MKNVYIVVNKATPNKFELAVMNKANTSVKLVENEEVVDVKKLAYYITFLSKNRTESVQNYYKFLYSAGEIQYETACDAVSFFSSITNSQEFVVDFKDENIIRTLNHYIKQLQNSLDSYLVTGF